MPTETEGRSPTRTSISGGASTEPTSANTVNSVSGSKSGNKTFHKGGSHALLNEGPGHVAVSTIHKHSSSPSPVFECIRHPTDIFLSLNEQAHNARSTMGGFLGLTDQKTRAENNFLAQSDIVSGRTREQRVGTTCTTEDHSFMEQKAGAPDTPPGWETAKKIIPG